MCISPVELSDGTQVSCRLCWQCRATRIDDWVGRCIAESKTVAAAHAITLTYGRDQSTDSVTYGEAEHERAIVLTYSDVQKYFKLLRRRGFPLRYFVTGEYGSAKGRAHWHVIVFWLDKVPEHVIGERFREAHWPHGASFWTLPEYENFRYNCKYILKTMGQGAAERQGHLAMSKKPPLGAEYFRRMARRYAEEGLAPKDGYYTFPEAVRRNGERVQFRLEGASKALFIEAWAAAWVAIHGDKPRPYSEWVEDHLDPWSDLMLSGIERKPPRAIARPGAEICGQLSSKIGEAVQPERLVWYETLNSYGFVALDGSRYVWRYDPQKEVFRWLDAAKERAGRLSRAEWNEAVSAARQTDRPWLIIPGRKPRVSRPGA